ncbi:MAG: M48 family metalloprotease [Sulfuricurvum sp.]|nr:M48 family metalloprotease [Sulfuricurvum sp.]MDP3023001.1 M48 family metalloprotease [Sulfuricurvum sp.]
MNLSQQLIPLNKSLMSNEHNIKYFEHDFDNIAFSYKMDNVIFVSVNKDLTKKYRPEEVEGILHHEIGHIELGHSKKILIIETLIVLTTLSLMTLSPYLFITYIPLYIFKMYVIRFHEYQADKYSMSKSYGLYNLFRRIRIIEVDSILNTHPTIKQRLKYIEQIITKDKK